MRHVFVLYLLKDISRNDYAPGTRAVTKPGKDGTVTINGKNYVYDRFLYVFKCEPGKFVGCIMPAVYADIECTMVVLRLETTYYIIKVAFILS